MCLGNHPWCSKECTYSFLGEEFVSKSMKDKTFTREKGESSTLLMLTDFFKVSKKSRIVYVLVGKEEIKPHAASNCVR